MATAPQPPHTYSQKRAKGYDGTVERDPGAPTTRGDYPDGPSKDPSNDGLYVIHKLAALVIGVTASYAAFATAVPGFASRVMPWRLSSCAACLGSGLTALLGGRGAAAMANVAACPTRPISSIRRGRLL